MIQAVNDKIIVEVMVRTKTRGGIILPGTSQDPQGYGRVFSVGEDIKDKVVVGDYLVFHPRAGMDMNINDKILKVLKYEELYGRITDSEMSGELSLVNSK